MIELNCYCEKCGHVFTLETSEVVRLIDMTCPRCKEHVVIRHNVGGIKK